MALIHMRDEENQGWPLCWEGGYKHLAVGVHPNPDFVTCLYCMDIIHKARMRKDG